MYYCTLATFIFQQLVFVSHYIFNCIIKRFLNFISFEFCHIQTPFLLPQIPVRHITLAKAVISYSNHCAIFFHTHSMM